LQACIPGCEEVTNDSDPVRRARVMVKLGPVRARFSGTLTLSEVVVSERCLMRFEGSGGAAGMASGRSQVELIEENGLTRVTYTVQASVGGKLGQIGGRLLDASARQLADQFFAALRERLANTAVTQRDQASDTSPIPANALVDGRVEGAVDGVVGGPSFASGSGRSGLDRATSESAGTPEVAPALVSSVPPTVASTVAPTVTDAVPSTFAPVHAPVLPSLLEAESSRLLWFLMGVATTGFGVWLGALLF
jgi:carbon monoxide dehydrogenase subunit G